MHRQAFARGRNDVYAMPSVEMPQIKFVLGLAGTKVWR